MKKGEENSCSPACEHTCVICTQGHERQGQEAYACACFLLIPGVSGDTNGRSPALQMSQKSQKWILCAEPAP